MEKTSFQISAKLMSTLCAAAIGCFLCSCSLAKDKHYLGAKLPTPTKPAGEQKFDPQASAAAQKPAESNSQSKATRAETSPVAANGAIVESLAGKSSLPSDIVEEVVDASSDSAESDNVEMADESATQNADNSTVVADAARIQLDQQIPTEPQTDIQEKASDEDLRLALGKLVEEAAQQSAANSSDIAPASAVAEQRERSVITVAPDGSSSGVESYKEQRKAFSLPSDIKTEHVSDSPVENSIPKARGRLSSTNVITAGAKASAKPLAKNGSKDSFELWVNILAVGSLAIVFLLVMWVRLDYDHKKK